MNKVFKRILIVLVFVLIIVVVIWALRNSKKEETNVLNNNLSIHFDNNEVIDNSTESEINNNEENRTMKLKINGEELTATLIDNSSTRALLEKLAEGEITINMSDYGNMEKVGDLGFSLPRNDIQISTDAGDLILYQGNSFVIYYDTNNWSFTRLGKIDGVSKAELKAILGNENVIVTLSLDD